jgi:hypothetical protein
MTKLVGRPTRNGHNFLASETKKQTRFLGSGAASETNKRTHFLGSGASAGFALLGPRSRNVFIY